MPDSTEPLPPSAPVRIFRCECDEDYMCAGHGVGVLGDADRPDWGTVSRWQRDADVELLARAIEDLTDLPPSDAVALAAALRPLDGQLHVAVIDSPDAIVSRPDLRRLADRSQVAGPEMEHAWGAYRAAGLEAQTTWQAFVAGIRAAAEWRRA